MKLRRVLATVLHDLGRYEEAQEAYRQVLTDQERVLGTDHPDTLNTRHKIANQLH